MIYEYNSGLLDEMRRFGIGEPAISRIKHMQIDYWAAQPAEVTVTFFVLPEDMELMRQKPPAFPLYGKKKPGSSDVC